MTPLPPCTTPDSVALKIFSLHLQPAVMTDTEKQWKRIIHECKEILLKKHQDYGSSWRLLRSSSLTDQLWIKALRIRNLEQGIENQVGDSITTELRAIVNYGIMALIQFQMPATTLINAPNEIELTQTELLTQVDNQIKLVFELMQKKNHDYGEAWRWMRTSSITDFILVKLYRIRQIEANNNQTLISEGIPAQYMDIINYAIFAIILHEEMGNK